MPTITFEDDDGEEHALPARFEVCDRCEGHGMHLSPSIGEHAYSAEEFAESYDEDEAAEYFTRGGMYDVTCLDCGGARVVAVVDETACPPALLAAFLARQEEDAEWARESAAERRMGA